jgi:hypothetical protein
MCVRWFLLAAITLTGACASNAPINAAFDPGAGKALLLIAQPMTAWDTTHSFRRVNLETGEFLGDAISVSAGLLGGASHLNTDDPRRRVMLAFREVEPGDYARVGLSGGTGNMFVSGSVIYCFDDDGGAPVFTLRPGEISIIVVDDITIHGGAYDVRVSHDAPTVPDPVALEDFARARERYPAIAGDAVVAAPRAAIHWPGETALQRILGRCANLDRFSVMPAGSEAAWARPVPPPKPTPGT